MKDDRKLTLHSETDEVEKKVSTDVKSLQTQHVESKQTIKTIYGHFHVSLDKKIVSVSHEAVITEAKFTAIQLVLLLRMSTSNYL